jgi:tetratricopeptide (TPR) repeat protein
MGEGQSSAPKDPQEMSVTLSGNETGSLSQIDIARRRVALRAIIRKWDYYQARNDALKSVQLYEKAYAQIQDDPKVAVRLASAYFELKEFRKAADIFTKMDVSQFDEPSKLRIIASILLDPERTDRKEVLSHMNFTAGTKEYVSLVDDCTMQPDQCLQKIRDSSSNDPRVLSLKDTVKNASVTSEDPLYIQALLVGKLFEQKAYLAVRVLGNKILERRPDYRVILKIVGYSDYELGNYTSSASLLERYYTLAPSDVEVAYMLGIVNYYKEDYSTSNLYFNNAVLNGYSPKTELERRLIYNYILLGDTKGAFKIFRYLLDESDVTAEDFEIALFLANQSEEYSKAHLWAQKWRSKFPESANILAFAGGALRRSGDQDEAEGLLRQAILLDGRNAIASLELGRLFIDKKEYDIAKQYLTDAVGFDTEWFFAKEAETVLNSIPTMQTENTGALSTESNNPLSN